MTWMESKRAQWGEVTGSSVLAQESESFLIVSPCGQWKEKLEKNSRKKMIYRILLRSLTQNKSKITSQTWSTPVDTHTKHDRHAEKKINFGFLWPLNLSLCYREAMLEERQLPSVNPALTVCSCANDSLSTVSIRRRVRETERERKEEKDRELNHSSSAAVKASQHIPADQKRVWLSQSANRADSWCFFVAGATYGCSGYDSLC